MNCQMRASLPAIANAGTCASVNGSSRTWRPSRVTGFPESIQDYFPCVGRYGIFGPASFSASTMPPLMQPGHPRDIRLCRNTSTARVLFRKSPGHRPVAPGERQIDGFPRSATRQKDFCSTPPAGAPSAISPRIPSNDSVRGSSAVRMLTSAHCAAPPPSSGVSPCRAGRPSQDDDHTPFRHFPDRFDGYPQCVWGVGKIDDGGKGWPRSTRSIRPGIPGMAAIPSAIASASSPVPACRGQRRQAVRDVKRPTSGLVTGNESHLQPL